MKHQRIKRTFALVLALLCAVSCAAPALAAGQEDAGAQIEAYVREHEDTLAGMAVSIFNAESVEYENYFGYADREAGVPVTEDTVFDWGSITKLTVWISVMQLWEQGKLDLAADIRTYLPDGFLTRLTYDEPVTLIHLMNHQGGFEDAVMGMETPDERDILPLETYLFRYQPAQVYAPGTVTAYNNWSTALAGYIVERVSGEPFYQYVQNHLFKPIGIEHAALNSDLSDDPWVKERRLALRGYDTKGDPLRGPFEYLVAYPGGMCASPLRELRRFAQELLKPDTVWFQSPETYYEMFSPTAFYGDTDLALNSHGFWHIRCYAEPVIGHGGNTSGCSSKLMLDPESGRGMVVMVNQQQESVFTHLMAETVFGKGEWEKPDYRGWLESARTTYSGLMKVYHIVSTFSPANAEVVYESDFCVRGTSGGVEKICSCYGDYLVRTPGEVLPMSLMLGWGALGIVFAVVILLWRGVACLVRRGKRCPADGLAVSAALLSLAVAGMLLTFAISLLSLDMWRPLTYRLWSIGMLVLMIVLAALVIRGLCFFRKLDTKGRRALRVAVLIAAAGIAANIAYWNLFMFWTA